MLKPSLTIGMACYDDFPGVWMTIQHLRMFHSDVLHECELIVVDNHPNSPHSQAIKDLVTGHVRGSFFRTEYIPFGEYNSTAAPRQKIFEVALSDNVLVIDSHIMFERKQGEVSPLRKLIDYYNKNPNAFNLLQGPLVYDDLRGISTHFDDVFRDEMWGIWGTDSRGLDPNNEPFEIFAQGLGLFSSRREAWLAVGGFNPMFRGFGGEECYIHEKFRKYGKANGVDGRTLCLPFLRWVHRFGHAGGVKYPLSLHDKCRNYIIGYQELDLPLRRVAKHFMTRQNEDASSRQGSIVTPDQWNHILKNLREYPIKFPLNGDSSPQPSPQPAKVAEPPVIFYPDMSEAAAWEAAVRRQDGVGQMLPFLSTWLTQHDDDLGDVAVITDRVETCLAVSRLDHEPECTVSFRLPVSDPLYGASNRDLMILLNREGGYDFSLNADIQPDTFDTVILQGPTTAPDIQPLLNMAGDASRRYLIIVGTSKYAEGSASTGPALQPAIRYFCKSSVKKIWTVIYHSKAGDPLRNDGLGFMILSCHDDDRPKLPSTFKMATNLAKAMVEHVVDGAKKSSEKEMRTRLSICSLCPNRTLDPKSGQDRCSICGCFIHAKAGMQEQPCPLGFWDNPHYRQVIDLPVATGPAVQSQGSIIKS